MTNPAALREEILRLTREYSRQVHAGFRPAADPDRTPWQEGTNIPYAGRVFTEDEVEAGTMAKYLDKLNVERKSIVAVMVKEIKKHWNEKDPEKKRKVLVAGNPDWKPSLLGLVANSLLDDHNGPVFLWGREEGKTLKGSCRSDGCISIVDMMEESKDLFLEYGGHHMTGGFSVLLEKVDLLADGLELAYEKLNVSGLSKKEVVVDAELKLEDITFDLEKKISRLSPFGVGNNKPVFVFRGVEIIEIKIFGKSKEHLEISFKKNNVSKISAISFFTKVEDFNKEIKVGDKVDLLGTLDKSNFRGRVELRIRVVDIF